MNKTAKNPQKKMKSRAELINASRTSSVRDYLPPSSDEMFAMLKGFKPGVAEFVDITQVNKP
jgi:hypothetical protein